MESEEKEAKTKTLTECGLPVDKMMKEASTGPDLNREIEVENGEGKENGVRVCGGNEGFATTGVGSRVDGGGDDQGRIVAELAAGKSVGSRRLGGSESSVSSVSESSVLRKVAGGREGGMNDGGTAKSDVINVENAAGSDNFTATMKDDSTRKVESDGNGEFGGRDRMAVEILKSGDEKGLELKIEAEKASDLYSKVSKNKIEHEPDAKIMENFGLLSKRTISRAAMGEKDETQVPNFDQSVMDREDKGDQEIDFSVGDFVWGKIRSHPWWPGRIYNPLDASEHALEYKHEDRLLVAYFGDGTFAWCNPGQLKPFVENFEEMSKQSNLKGFINAVEEAIDEFGWLVELETACSCVSKDHRSRPTMFNAGVKEGVNVPEGGIGKISITLVQPAEILADVRCIAYFVSVPNMLQLAALKNLLSAFYRAKGCSQLQEYHEPLEIGEEIDTSVEGSHRGPVEECILIPGDDQHRQDMAGTLETNLSKRKEKSIAEILGRDTGVESNSNEADVVLEQDQFNKWASESGRKKRKIGNEAQSPEDDNFTAKMGRRKTRMLLRSVAADRKALDCNDGSALKEQKSFLSKRKLRGSPAVEDDCVAEETNEKSPHPRERKKSKYLSPPYTSPELWQRDSSKRHSGGAALEFSNTAKMGQRMTRAASELISSPPILKCSAETFQKTLPKEVGSDHWKFDLSDPKTPKIDLRSKNDMAMKFVSSLSKMLSDIRTAALNPQYSTKHRSFEAIKGFLSSYRSLEYKNGANYNFHRRIKAKQAQDKWNHLEPELGSEALEPKTQHRRGRRNKEEKSGSKGKDKVGEGTVSSAVLLLTFPPEFSLPSKDDLNTMYRKFGALNESRTKVLPRSSSAKIFFLRSPDAKEALSSLQKSSPFGAAKVSCRIRLVSPTPETKGTNKNSHPEPSTSKRKKTGKCSPKQYATVQSDGESSELTFVRQKLMAMASMLADGDGKMSQEMKTNLEKQMKELLRKLKTMAASPTS
ncbi:hypothetical protein Ancab_025751 [Ancistrocladus abbreviatus]